MYHRKTNRIQGLEIINESKLTVKKTRTVPPHLQSDGMGNMLGSEVVLLIKFREIN